MKNYSLIASFVFAAVSLSAQTTVNTYTFTGTQQYFVVPSCVFSVTISASGAQGMSGNPGGVGGLGGQVQGDQAVNPGDTLFIFVGGQSGYNGGGLAGAGGPNLSGTGGGASDVRLNSTSMGARVIVGPGGGGGSGNPQGSCGSSGGGIGGFGGGSIGGNGSQGAGCGPGGSGGMGGDQSIGGANGVGNSNCSGTGGSGTVGGMGIGGNGGAGIIGCSGFTGAGGGGGGGGYFGGGGGGGGAGGGAGAWSGGGGGGGSAYFGTLANLTALAGSNTGNGIVTITYSSASSLPTTPVGITGTGVACEGTSLIYSISPVAGATTYTWSVPAGTVITNGQTTTSVTVTAGTTSGYIYVTANNSCGSSLPDSIAVTYDLLNVAGTVTSDTAVCSGSTITMNESGSSSADWYEYDGANYNMLGSGSTYATTSIVTAGTHTFVLMASGGSCPADTSSFTTTRVDSAYGGIIYSAGGTDVCPGDSAGLTAIGASGNIEWWVWLAAAPFWQNVGSGNTFDPFSPQPGDTGTYMFIAISSDGMCPIDTSDTLTLTVHIQPDVQLGSDGPVCGTSVVLDAGNVGSSYSWSTTDTTQMITVTSPATYSVDVTSPFGCVGSGTITITALNANPVIVLGPDTTQCGGGVLLDAQIAGATYMWSDSSNSQTITATTSGLYWVDVTDANGCSDQDSISVTINPLPAVAGAASSNTVCLDDANVVLTGTPAGGSWSGPGVTGTNFDPSIGTGPQLATYTYTDSNGCWNTAVVTIAVNACVGIAEQTAGIATIYPNPNNGMFTLVMNSANQNVAIEITDLQGRIVYTSCIQNMQPGASVQIDLSNEADGTYFMRTTSGEQQSIQKIIINR